MSASTEARMQIGYRGRAAGLDKPVTQDTRRLETFQHQRRQAEEAAKAKAQRERLDLGLKAAKLNPGKAQLLSNMVAEAYKYIGGNPDISDQELNSIKFGIEQVREAAEEMTEVENESYKEADLANTWASNFVERDGGVFYDFVSGEELADNFRNSVTSVPEVKNYLDFGEVLGAMSSKYKEGMGYINSGQKIPELPKTKDIIKTVTNAFKETKTQIPEGTKFDRTGELILSSVTENLPENVREAIIANLATEHQGYFGMLAAKKGIAENEKDDFVIEEIERLVPNITRDVQDTEKRTARGLKQSREDRDIRDLTVVDSGEDSSAMAFDANREKAEKIKNTLSEIIGKPDDETVKEDWAKIIHDPIVFEMFPDLVGSSEEEREEFFNQENSEGEKIIRGDVAKVMREGLKSYDESHIIQEGAKTIPLPPDLKPITLDGREIVPNKVVVNKDGSRVITGYESTLIDVNTGKTITDRASIKAYEDGQDITKQQGLSERDSEKQKIKVNTPFVYEVDDENLEMLRQRLPSKLVGQLDNLLEELKGKSTAQDDEFSEFIVED